MVAVITSTIKPTGNKSYYSYPERLEQTIHTLKSLQKIGFDKIYLVDNSPGLTQEELEQLLTDHASAKVYHIDQHQFNNKGINEILMLLFVCAHLPANEPIFKISGRYLIKSSFKKPEFADIAIKGYHFTKKNGTISTRAYWINNSELFESFLNNTLIEVFAYPERVVGLRSLLKKIKHIFYKQGQTMNISIEFAAANVLKHSKYDVSFLNELNIEGFVAGSDRKEKIVE